MGKIKKKVDKKRVFLLLAIIILLSFIIILFFFTPSLQTGKAILELKPEIGEEVGGFLTFHLKEGELLPANTKVIASLNQQKKEYSLSDLVGNERKKGPFFLEEKDLSGSGEGFGFSGKRVVHPEITLTVVIQKEVLQPEQNPEKLDSDGDGFFPLEDCDDTDANVNPSQLEILGNGKDDDCNVATLDSRVGTTSVVDHDGDGFSPPEDCDDTEEEANPSQREILNNGKDDDCNDATEDKGVAKVIDQDEDGFSSLDDCDDTKASIYPGARERCNGIKDNCDGDIDEGCACVDGVTQFCGTNMGTCTRGIQTCSEGAWGDCSGQGPEQEECNGKDDDCNGAVDEGLLKTFYLDEDGDSYGREEEVLQCAQGVYADNTFDCNDADAKINPAQQEVLYNGKDDDCNAATQDDDFDGDGYEKADDCNDDDRTVNPEALEVCNGVDDNCDRETDSGCECTNGERQSCGIDLGICSSGEQTCVQGKWGVCGGEVGPLQETCNGKDDDCNGAVDEGLLKTFYLDEDGDSYGGENFEEHCTKPSRFSDTGLDCDDSDNKISPREEEIPGNGKDDDCNDDTSDILPPSHTGGSGVLPPSEEVPPPEKENEPIINPVPSPSPELSPSPIISSSPSPSPSSTTSPSSSPVISSSPSSSPSSTSSPILDSSPSPFSTTSPTSSPSPTGITGFFVKMTGFITKITGNMIRSFTGNAVREQRASPLTGNAIVVRERRINGVIISADHQVSFDLEDGEVIKILEAKTSKGDVALDQIQITSDGKKAVLSTSYQEEQEGFGEIFLTDKAHAFDLDLKRLKIEPEDGFLNVRLVYKSEEIFDIAKQIDVTEGCETKGFACKASCSSQEEGKNESCLKGVCCGPKLLKGCAELKGEICNSYQECKNGEEVESKEGNCCSGACKKIEEKSECKEKNFSCKTSCSFSEEKKNFTCDTGICCAPQGLKTCFVLQGKICKSNEVCSTDEVISLTGDCCRGVCEKKITSRESNTGGLGQGGNTGDLGSEDNNFSDENEEEIDQQAGDLENETLLDDNSGGDEMISGEEIVENQESKGAVQQAEIPQVEIQGITARNFVLGAVARFQVLIDNQREIPLEDVFVNIIVGEAVFKSPLSTVPAKSKIEIIAYGDTSSLEEGVYDGKVVFVYQGSEYAKNVRVKIGKDSASFVLKEKKGASTLIVFLAVLFLTVGAWLIVLKFIRKKNILQRARGRKLRKR